MIAKVGKVRHWILDVTDGSAGKETLGCSVGVWFGSAVCATAYHNKLNRSPRRYRFADGEVGK